MRPFRVEAPASPLVPLADLRAHGRADTADEDALLQGFERAAVAYLDGYTGRLGRCVLRQKWALPLTDQPQAVQLPFPDCRDFKIEQRDAFGVWSEVADVTITQFDDNVLLTNLPADQSGLHLTCIAGWETVDDVPDSLKQAVQMLVAHWSTHRGAVSQSDAAEGVPFGVAALLQPLTVVFG